MLPIITIADTQSIVSDSTNKKVKQQETMQTLALFPVNQTFHDDRSKHSLLFYCKSACHVIACVFVLYETLEPNLNTTNSCKQLKIVSISTNPTKSHILS